MSVLHSVCKINIDDYDYTLSDDWIAKFPMPERDQSKLLYYCNGEVSESIFYQLPSLLPAKSLIVFNNTRVIQARLLFMKETGAKIELFCLEPEDPKDYALNFQSCGQCRWVCLVGNAKRWKSGALARTLYISNMKVTLTAERQKAHGQMHSVKFTWDELTITFAEILDAAGVLPIPPYLHRTVEKSDFQTYQTVYSKIKGSVASPTAGLHFTPEVLKELDNRGFIREELTLHVGAGTFKPVQTALIGEHEMHSEYFSINRTTIQSLMENIGRITAVGTTSVRTLESLYYIGASLTANSDVLYPYAHSDEQSTFYTCSGTPLDLFIVKQWAPYENNLLQITTDAALQNILNYLENNNMEKLIASTQIMIVPGYKFRLVNNLITNFHQPKSTLLLLVSAFVNGDWKKIYNYALNHHFRFLSYGDSSLLVGATYKT